MNFLENLQLTTIEGYLVDTSIGGAMRALIFDLDGTLVDTVYAHILAWQNTFSEAGISVDAWRIHRKVGMSGDLFTRAVGRDIGREFSTEESKIFQKRHVDLYLQILPNPRPLSGAVELLKFLQNTGIKHAIATSGKRKEIQASLEALKVSDDTVIISGDDVSQAKPEPDLFFEAQKKLDVAATECYVIGDAVWDVLAARRARMLSVGFLCGGYGEDELAKAGAFRIYRDAEELLHSLDELGVLP